MSTPFSKSSLFLRLPVVFAMRGRWRIQKTRRMHAHIIHSGNGLLFLLFFWLPFCLAPMVRSNCSVISSRDAREMRVGCLAGRRVDNQRGMKLPCATVMGKNMFLMSVGVCRSYAFLHTPPSLPLLVFRHGRPDKEKVKKRIQSFHVSGVKVTHTGAGRLGFLPVPAMPRFRVPFPGPDST